MEMSLTVNMESITSVLSLDRSQKGQKKSYQLNPGVDTDGEGIHRLHIVPPVSGNEKHLWEQREGSVMSHQQCTGRPLDGSTNRPHAAGAPSIHKAGLLKRRWLIDS